MKRSPPKLLEFVVGILIPPACREHVLGDLHERFTSTKHYVADALNIVPSVIFSQVRRGTDPQLFTIQIFSVFICFLAAAWYMEGASILQERGFLRLAIPTLSAVLGFVLAEAYAINGREQAHQPFLNSTLAIGFVFLSQGALIVLKPTLLLPRQTMIIGVSIGALLLCAARLLFPPESALRAALKGTGAGMNTEQRPPSFRRWGWVNLELGSVILLFVGVFALAGGTIVDQAAGVLIIAVAVFIGYQVYRRVSIRQSESLRAQLERRRDAIRSIWSWYVLPFFVALLAFAVRIPLARLDQPEIWPNLIPFVVLAAGWSITMVKLSAREARKLQDEIDKL